MNNLKEIRLGFNISAKTAAKSIGVPLRTYIRYEQDDNYGNHLKRTSMINALIDAFSINEDKGILDLQTIKNVIGSVFSKHIDAIEFCYLFGSYAKGYAKEDSDVDLCIDTSISGLAFVGLIEELRFALNKRVDLIRLSDLNDNMVLIKEILKDGIRIYDQQ